MAKPTKVESESAAHPVHKSTGPAKFDSPFPHEEGQHALTKDDLSALREKRIEPTKPAPAPAKAAKPKLPPPEIKYPVITAADIMKGHSKHMAQMKQRRLEVLARKHPEVADLLKENAELKSNAEKLKTEKPK